MNEELIPGLIARTGRPEEWCRRYLGVARGDAALVQEYARLERLQWSDDMIIKLVRFNALKRMSEVEADASVADRDEIVRFVRSSWTEEDRQAKQPRLQDPVLGPLVWNDTWWDGSAVVKGLGKAGQPVPLAVRADRDAGPTDAQRRAFAAFTAGAKDHLAAADQATFDHYNRVKEKYRDDLTPAEVKRFVPDLAKPADVRRLLKQPRILIPPQPERGWTLHLDWECRWDDEHGHQVDLTDGKVTRVGTQH